MAKFVDTLPGLGSGKKNNLGQYLQVAVPDTTTFPGSDYYIIELREFSEKMHSDLNPTKLRGYVQVDSAGNPVINTPGDPGIHYLGPVIVAERDRPVRIKFSNKLPNTAAGGNLFIPVDTSVMGAGEGPITGQNYTQNRAAIHLHGGRTPWISDGTPHQWITPADETSLYRSGVSLQNVPDMCFDGAGNAIPRATDPNCLTGSSNPGPGSTTYYFTNQQSARLMFYHDHAFGITRLNVYAGEAAGYLITDRYEKDLVDNGIIPGDQIPLILQDKTFVDATPVFHPVTGAATTQIRITDPLWNWGSGTPDVVTGIRPPVTGDLWMPHVYMPAQLPTSSGTGGVNPFGRWMYGPFFYPPTVVTNPPVDNPYYDPNCDSVDPFLLAQCEIPGQPPKIPSTPNVAMGMEAFQDSAVVNGTVFPSLTVDPRAYRFRILNAASDRFWNLNFYKADPAQISPDTRPASRLTEVKMLPASPSLATQYNWPANWPVDGRDGGVPDPAFRGPKFLQIGSEGGFLPQPVLIEHQPITYNVDPTAFWVGNVDKMGLALGPAERADVIVDFSEYAGKTLILYNDAPAAWPARVPGYDYYTGAPDLRDSGGYGTGGTFNLATGAWENGTGPLVGYAPNTRTVMQVIVRQSVGTDPSYTFNKANLEKEFTSSARVTVLNPAPVKTLFERSQEPIIVGQSAYNNAYPNSYFPTNFPWEGVNQINDHFLQFVTVAGEKVKITTEPKGIHDEQGASFDPVYGRMSGNLAMQRPNPTTLNANLILYGFSDIPTETVDNSTTVNVQVLPNADPAVAGTKTDGTQIWKISHNGVDTHPIHFHIFDVQLINRVGWDGQILMPEPNELGWKDTIKISPLEDTIVAVRPRAPALPFGIPTSQRPLNPAIPIDSGMGFTQADATTPASIWPFFSSIDWTTGQAYPAQAPAPAPLTNYPYPNFKGVVTNVLYDFGWEYVWHCHILSHEEMDMMRPIVLRYDATLPPAFTAMAVVNAVAVKDEVTWSDPTPVNYDNPDIELYRNSSNEVGFNVYQSDNNGATYSKLNTVNLPANTTKFVTAAVSGSLYYVEAFNAKGSTNSPVVRPLSVTVTLNGSSITTAPATIVLDAAVSGALGTATITSVEFFNGVTSIGTSLSAGSPYTLSWTPVTTAGTYNITAKVTDSLGAVATSAILPVVVTGTLTADFTVTGSAAGADIGFCENITFASTSSDTSPGAVLGYKWTINGVDYLAVNPLTLSPPVLNSATYPVTYPVTLTVTNGTSGETAQVTKNVTIVNHNPTAVLGIPTIDNTGVPIVVDANGYYTFGSTDSSLTLFNPKTSITLNGSGTDLQDTCDVTPLTYAWNIDNKGNYDFFTANPSISYNTLKSVLGVGTHTMTFKVTDSKGGVGTASATLVIGDIPATSISNVLAVYKHVTRPVGDPPLLSATELLNADVAPLKTNGTPNGNGLVDIADVIILLRRLIGAATW